MPSFEIDPVPVLVGGIAAFMLGGVWYGPMFGGVWTSTLGIDPDDLGPVVFAVGFLSYLMVAVALSLVVSWAGADSVLSGMLVAGAVGVGIAVGLGMNLTFFAGRPLSAFLIESGYQLVAFLLIGGVLGGWRW